MKKENGVKYKSICIMFWRFVLFLYLTFTMQHKFGYKAGRVYASNAKILEAIGTDSRDIKNRLSEL